MAILLRDPYAVPSGIAPGIDQTHPAAQGCVLSAVATRNGFFNLTRGGVLPASTVGTPGTAINANMGLCATNTGTTQIWRWSGGPTNTEPSMTMARIGLHTGGTAFLLTTGDSTANTAGWRFDISVNVLRMVSNGGAAKNGPTISLSTPYFMAVSINSGATNFVVRNLVTGQVQTSTTTGTTATASDGFTNIGGGSGNTGNQSVAAASISHTFMSLQQLLAWSQDPWAFWYPNEYPFPDFDVGTAAIIPPNTGGTLSMMGV